MELKCDSFSMKAVACGTTVQLIFSIHDRNFYSGYATSLKVEFTNRRKHPAIASVMERDGDVILELWASAASRDNIWRIYNLWVRQEIRFQLAKAFAA
ncbi:MAG: hypothetical protein AB7F86_01300 [Bdellovibrionales bacterium]